MIKLGKQNLQYNIKREVGKVSALSWCKIDKYEYLTGEEILSLDQRRVIEQAKIYYSCLGKALEKQRKTNKALKDLKPEENHELELTE